MGTVDIRCPNGLRTLLMRLKLEDTPGSHASVTEGNLMELACSDCRTRLRKTGVTNSDGTRISLVLHRFNLLGELIETEIR